MASVLTAKIVTMVILGGVSFLLGVVPIKLAEKYNWKEDTSRKTKFFLTSVSCFGAGVILTTTLTHMLPEVNHFLDYNYESGQIVDKGMPLAEILVLCGFLMVYLTEEVAHFVVDKYRAKNKLAANANGTTNQTKGEESGGKESESTDTNSTAVSSPQVDHEPKANGDSNSSEEAKKLGTGDDFAMTIANEESFQAKLRGFLVILALSLHAVFEGIAVGLLQKASYVWYLCFAIAAHKFVIAFCLGMQFVASGKLSNLLIVLYIGTFSLISPLGIGIGIGLTASAGSEEELQTPTVTVLQALATGTLLYVVFFEVLEKERSDKNRNGLLQVIAFAVGFVVMVVVQIAESGGEHGHTHGHSHGH